MTLSADISTILNRILDTAAENLRVAKILIQLGLDPNNITYDAIFNRLLELLLANITLANLFALIGAIFFVATLLTQTMVPLRVANMIGCAFFAAFGALTGTIRRYSRNVVTFPASAPNPAKKAQPIIFATRNGTMVCVSKVATKKIAPISANRLASVMLARKISSSRLKIAS